MNNRACVYTGNCNKEDTVAVSVSIVDVLYFMS